jgi:hypothetical protein
MRTSLPPTTRKLAAGPCRKAAEWHPDPMPSQRSLPPVVRRVLRGLAVWWAFQLVVSGVVRLVARRRNQGDETSTSIRRLQSLGSVELRPSNPALARVRIGLVMAGGVLDLSALPRVPGGIDVTVRAVFGGMAVQVPPGWRVWWRFRGVGGIGADGPVVRTKDDAGADLRLHVVAVLGGVGIESAG